MSLVDSIQRVSRTVAWVNVDRTEGSDRGSGGLGTGFVAGRSGEILTCAHILRDARKIEVTVMGAKAPSPATVLATDAAADLALLKVEARDFPAASLWRGSSIAIGREVAFLGFPHSDFFSPPLAMTMRGIVGNRYRLGSVEYYIVDASASEGMSGAPLFLAETGEVIGVVGGRFDPGRTRARLSGMPSAESRALPAERTNIMFAASIEYAIALMKARA